MNILDVSSVSWRSFVWTVIGVAAAFPLLAILSPRLFAKLNACASFWVDIDGLVEKANKRVDIDYRVIPYSRLLGALTLVATGFLASSFRGLPHAPQLAVLSFLGLVGVSALLALLSPRAFSKLASWGSLWIDTDKYVNVLNHRVEIDHHVLRHTRLFGVVVLAGLCVLATLLVVWA